MTTALSFAQLNDLLWANVQALTISKDSYKAAQSSLEQQLKDPVPPARNWAFQGLMNTTYALYQERVRSSMGTLKAQYKLGKRVEALFNNELDPHRLLLSMTAFKAQFRQLLDQHTANEAHVNSLINRIVELMSSENPELWEAVRTN